MVSPPPDLPPGRDTPDSLPVASLLDLSDKRDAQLAARLEAWRDGYRTCAADFERRVLDAFADGWRQGLAAGTERQTTA